jgi:hypothetical protein
MQILISANANIPIYLALNGSAVTGRVAADLVVKVYYSNSTDLELLTATTHYTLDEGSLGWYRLTILAAKINLAGMFMVDVSSATSAFETQDYMHEIISGKTDLVDAPNATAITAIQLGLSKPATAQTITANQNVNVNQIGGSAAAATNLSTSALTMITGTVVAGATTSIIESADINDAQANLYNGRIMIFITGTLTRCVCTIVTYSKVGSNGHFVVAVGTGVLPAAPAAGVGMLIL